MAKAGISCEGTPGPYQAHGDDILSGTGDPTEALRCTTPDGVRISASRWDTTDGMTAALGVFESMMCEFGGDVAFVLSGSASIRTSGDKMSNADYEAINKTAEALDTKVTEPCGKVDADSLADASSEFGEPVDLGDRITITLSNPRVGGDANGPWIEVDVVYTNDSSATAQTPTVSLVCGWTKEMGSYRSARPSTPMKT